jgi:uncharacterized protein with HEPN domain
MPPRDPCAYLCDILEAAAAIQEATGSIDEATYTCTRLIRSAVERGVHDHRRGAPGDRATGS